MTAYIHTCTHAHIIYPLLYMYIYVCTYVANQQHIKVDVFYIRRMQEQTDRHTDRQEPRQTDRRRSVLGPSTWICRGVPLHPWMDAATQEEDLTLVSRRNSTPPAPPPKASLLLAFPLIVLLVSKQEPDMCEGIFRKKSSIVIFMSSSCICNNG